MTTSSSPTTINHHHHISFFRAGGDEVLRAWAWSPQGPHFLKDRGVKENRLIWSILELWKAQEARSRQEHARRREEQTRSARICLEQPGQEPPGALHPP